MGLGERGLERFGGWWGMGSVAGTGGRWEITHLVDDTYDFDAPVFDPFGVAHLAYVDDDTDTLNVVTWDGAWSEPVDLGMDVEQVAAAAGPDGRLHLLVYARDGLHWLLDAGAGGFTEQIAPVVTEGDYVRDLWFAVDAEGVGHAVYIADGAVYVDQLTIP